MGKVVVMGATGVLGLPICRHLKKLGYNVFAVGHSQNKNDFFSNLGIEYTTFDIGDEMSYSNLPSSDVDCVLNFAGALPAMMTEGSSDRMYSDSIVRGTINVLEYMKKIGCRKIVFPQSVYDLNYLFGSSTPISADAVSGNPLHGDHSVYVICKNAAINIIRHYESDFNFQGIILRLPGVFQYQPKPYILINGKKRIKLERVWIEKAKRGKPLEVWGDCKRVLETVCIDDFLQIVEKCVESKTASGIYNVGNGEGASLEDRVLAIRDVFCPDGKKSDVIYYPERANCTQYVLDIEKTKNELGYEPHFTWRDYLINLKWHMEKQPNAEIWGRFEDYYSLLVDIQSDDDRFEK